MKTQEEVIDFCLAQLAEATRKRNKHRADLYDDGQVKAFALVLEFVKKDDVPAIQPIEHLQPVPGQSVDYLYREMVDKFNKMIDVFNEQIATKQ